MSARFPLFRYQTPTCRFHTLCTAALSLTLLLCFPQKTNGQEGTLDWLDSFVERVLDTWQAPGLALAVVKDDSVIFGCQVDTDPFGFLPLSLSSFAFALTWGADRSVRTIDGNDHHGWWRGCLCRFVDSA